MILRSFIFSLDYLYVVLELFYMFYWYMLAALPSIYCIQWTYVSNGNTCFVYLCFKWTWIWFMCYFAWYMLHLLALWIFSALRTLHVAAVTYMCSMDFYVFSGLVCVKWTFSLLGRLVFMYGQKLMWNCFGALIYCRDFVVDLIIYHDLKYIDNFAENFSYVSVTKMNIVFKVMMNMHFIIDKNVDKSFNKNIDTKFHKNSDKIFQNNVKGGVQWGQILEYKL